MNHHIDPKLDAALKGIADGKSKITRMQACLGVRERAWAFAKKLAVGQRRGPRRFTG
jgi:hypothetical protein